MSRDIIYCANSNYAPFVLTNDKFRNARKQNVILNEDIFAMKIKKCSKTCVKRPISKRSKIGFQDTIAKSRSNVSQNAPRGTFCNTFDLH